MGDWQRFKALPALSKLGLAAALWALVRGAVWLSWGLAALVR